MRDSASLAGATAKAPGFPRSPVSLLASSRRRSGEPLNCRATASSRSRLLQTPQERELRLHMPRKLTWIEKPGLAGWGCSECAWLFQAPSVPAGESSEEALRMIEELQ